MGFDPFRRLLFSTLTAILLVSCSQGEGVPGGQAGSKPLGPAGVPPREPVEVLVDGQLLRSLAWSDLEGLPMGEFNTGREDVQTGYYLSEVVKYLGVEKVSSVTLHGVTRRPISLDWEVVRNKENTILVGLTHKGTFKVVAGNTAILNRDGWVRHVVTMNIHRETQPEGVRKNVSDPEGNPLHPRKKKGPTD